MLDPRRVVQWRRLRRSQVAIQGRGTSLSKAFGLISRFSEDIDITIFRDDLGQGAGVEELEALSGKKAQSTTRRDQGGEPSLRERTDARAGRPQPA